eukprot:g1761.t1
MTRGFCWQCSSQGYGRSPTSSVSPGTRLRKSTRNKTSSHHQPPPLVTDYKNGTIVCSGCGLEIASNIIQEDYIDWRLCSTVKESPSYLDTSASNQWNTKPPPHQDYSLHGNGSIDQMLLRETKFATRLNEQQQYDRKRKRSRQSTIDNGSKTRLTSASISTRGRLCISPLQSTKEKGRHRQQITKIIHDQYGDAAYSPTTTEEKQKQSPPPQPYSHTLQGRKRGLSFTSSLLESSVMEATGGITQSNMTTSQQGGIPITQQGGILTTQQGGLALPTATNLLRKMSMDDGQTGNRPKSERRSKRDIRYAELTQCLQRNCEKLGLISIGIGGSGESSSSSSSDHTKFRTKNNHKKMNKEPSTTFRRHGNNTAVSCVTGATGLLHSVLEFAKAVYNHKLLKSKTLVTGFNNDKHCRRKKMQSKRRRGKKSSKLSKAEGGLGLLLGGLGKKTRRKKSGRKKRSDNDFLEIGFITKYKSDDLTASNNHNHNQNRDEGRAVDENDDSKEAAHIMSPGLVLPCCIIYWICQLHGIPRSEKEIIVKVWNPRDESDLLECRRKMNKANLLIRTALDNHSLSPDYYDNDPNHQNLNDAKVIMSERSDRVNSRAEKGKAVLVHDETTGLTSIKYNLSLRVPLRMFLERLVDLMHLPYFYIYQISTSDKVKWLQRARQIVEYRDRSDNLWLGTILLLSFHFTNVVKYLSETDIYAIGEGDNLAKQKMEGIEKMLVNQQQHHRELQKINGDGNGGASKKKLTIDLRTRRGKTTEQDNDDEEEEEAKGRQQKEGEEERETKKEHGEQCYHPYSQNRIYKLAIQMQCCPLVVSRPLELLQVHIGRLACIPEKKLVRYVEMMCNMTTSK